MKLKIDPKIFETFPETTIGVVIALGVDNKDYSDEIEELLRSAEEEIRNNLSLEDLAQQPFIKRWRETYRKFGEKKERSSHEALIRRVLKGMEIPRINKLVDLYNYISLKYRVPAGGEDLDKISGDIVLTFAEGTEQFIELGSGKQSNPFPGEVIYRDSEKVICRRWNWRESNETKITEYTKNAVFVIEGISDEDRDTIEKACSELANLINKFCRGSVKTYILDEKTNEAQIMV